MAKPYTVLRRPKRIPLNRQEPSVPESTQACWEILAKLRPFQRDLVMARLKELVREARETEEVRDV